MVHLNGRALPEATFEELQIDTEHCGTASQSILQTNRGDYSGEPNAAIRRPAAQAARRPRMPHEIRGPKPLLPRSLKEALQLADLLSKSKLIPKGFDTPETCLVGILYGMEVGLSPIAALQRMAVIDGRPTIWGDAALALVQASGLLQSITEEVIQDPEPGDNHGHDSKSSTTQNQWRDDQGRARLNNLTAICTVRREGRSEPTIGTFSIEDAKRAGLWQKPGPWTDYPNRMLTMRARAFALRDAFPDVLAGLYIREEFVGTERRQETPLRNRSDDDAEWNAAAEQGASGAIINNTQAHADEQKQTTGKATEREQGITSGYGFTPNPHDQNARLAPDGGQAITSGYDFEKSAHGFADKCNGGQSSFARRRAPPPPPDVTEKRDQAETQSDENETQSASEDLSGEGHINAASANTACQPVAEPNPDQPSFAETGDETLDPDTLIDLLDSALCCALDLPTLEEIIDEFAARLKGLPSDAKQRAQRIIERHHKRVEDLDRSPATDLEASVAASNTDQDPALRDAEANIPPELTSDTDPLPVGLKYLLPNLGLGRIMTRDRRRKSSRHQSRQLLSWNARTRLPYFIKASSGNDIPIVDPEETEE